MKTLFFVVFTFMMCSIHFSQVHAQDIKFSKTGLNFYRTRYDIVGKVGNHYVVFQNTGWRNILQILDEDMKEVKSERLRFLPEEPMHMNFIPCDSQFIMTWQYPRNGKLYIESVIMNAMGEIVSPVQVLDSAESEQVAKPHYNLIYSENRQYILFYQVNYTGDSVELVTNYYDSRMRLLKKTAYHSAFDVSKEFLNNFLLLNDGTLYCTLFERAGSSNLSKGFELLGKAFDADFFSSTPVPLQQHWIDNIKIKYDQANDQFVLNSFYFSQEKSLGLLGIFSARISRENGRVITAFNPLTDSLRNLLYTHKDDNNKQLFMLSDFFLRHDGSFLLGMESMVFKSNQKPVALPPARTATNQVIMRSGPPLGPLRSAPQVRSWPTSPATIDAVEADMVLFSLDTSLKMKVEYTLTRKHIKFTKGTEQFAIANVRDKLFLLYVDGAGSTTTLRAQMHSVSGKLLNPVESHLSRSAHQPIFLRAKQVSLNEVIIPCIHKGYLSYAKVSF